MNPITSEKSALLLVVVVTLLSGQLLDNTLYSVSTINLLAWCACYVFAFVALTVKYKLAWMKWFTARDLALVAVVFVAAISIFWSIDLRITTLRWVILTGGLVLSIFFTTSLPVSRTLTCVAITLVAILLINIALAYANPELAVQHYEKEQKEVWKGWYANKNNLAALAAVAFMISVFKVRSANKSSRFLFIGIALLAGFVLIKSNSATCILAVLAGTFCYLSMLLLGTTSAKNSTVLLTIAVYFSLIVGVSVLLSDKLSLIGTSLSMLDRSTSLTGRVDIWINTLDAISLKPLFGYGFGAVWAPKSNESIALQSELIGLVDWNGDPIATAHNGFLHLASELGIFMSVSMLLVFLLLMAKSFYVSLKYKQECQFAL